jgi:hypothetical protein
LAAVSAGTDNKIDARITLNSQPSDWQMPKKYTATLQIMNNGLTTLPDDNTTDNLVPTGNIIVKVQLSTVTYGARYRTDGATNYVDAITQTVNGSKIAVNGTDLVGKPMIYNSSYAEVTVPLPQDSQWHNVANFTCYYDVPTLPPEMQGWTLTKVNLHFDTTVFVETGGVISGDPSSGGLVLTGTFYGTNIGYSSTDYTAFEQVFATPTPNPTATPTPTPTATATPAPTQNVVSTPTPTPTPTTTPTLTPSSTTNPTAPPVLVTPNPTSTPTLAVVTPTSEPTTTSSGSTLSFDNSTLIIILGAAILIVAIICTTLILLKKKH